MKAKKFDTDFDAGKDISGSLDLSKARKPLQEQKRVNVDFPTWMIEALDNEASRLGVTRQSIIKVWLAERLELADGDLAGERRQPAVCAGFDLLDADILHGVADGLRHLFRRFHAGRGHVDHADHQILVLEKGQQ